VVVLSWVWLAKCLTAEKEQRSDKNLNGQLLSTVRQILQNGIPAAFGTLQQTRFLVVTTAAILIAAPWYVSVGIQTDWEWKSIRAVSYFIHSQCLLAFIHGVAFYLSLSLPHFVDSGRLGVVEQKHRQKIHMRLN
jgi:hypothetical protein